MATFLLFCIHPRPQTSSVQKDAQICYSEGALETMINTLARKQLTCSEVRLSTGRLSICMAYSGKLPVSLAPIMPSKGERFWIRGNLTMTEGTIHVSDLQVKSGFVWQSASGGEEEISSLLTSLATKLGSENGFSPRKISLKKSGLTLCS